MANSTPSKVCLDASIIVKFLTREEGSKKAASLLEHLINENTLILGPEFLKLEVVSVLRKKAYFKEISEKQARACLKLFRDIPIKYVDMNNKLLDSSYSLALALEQPVVYDCIYLALAKAEKAFFFTADEKFYNKAKSKYKKCKLL